MASSSETDDDQGLISGINVTPLVDVTLVLLIIFMVTAKIIVSQGMPKGWTERTGEAVVSVGMAVMASSRKSVTLPRTRESR